MAVVAVVGAGGKTGQAVVAALESRGVAPRRWVRRPTGHPDEVVVDLTDAASVAAAMAGVDAVYHLAPNVHPDEVDIGRRAISAARDAGVSRFVFHSVLHPQLEAMPHHWRKLRVEELVIESGLAWTILQPAAYAQNFSRPADGVLRVPYDLDARFSLVDLHDVAEVAAVMLTEDGHQCASYELAGPRPVSIREVAGWLDAVAERQSIEDWTARSGLTGYARDALVAMFRHYDRHGLVGNPGTLARLLGRHPTDPAEVLAEIVG